LRSDDIDRRLLLTYVTLTFPCREIVIVDILRVDLKDGNEEE
jgi:hypothetical protein